MSAAADAAVELGGLSSIESLLPEQSTEILTNEYTFWRYYGSLTTGDEGAESFLESVIWTVFKRPIMISYNQVGVIKPRHLDRL